MRKSLLLIFVFLLGCSSVEKIVSNNQDIQDLALDSKDRFEFIYEETGKPQAINIAEINKQAKQGILEQTNIVEKTKNIVQATTGVKDIAPWWADMVAYIVFGLSILGFVFLLWYLGVGHLTRALFRRLGYISSTKKAQAKLFLDAMDENNETSVKEAVAVLRAQDKDFDLAFKKRKEELNARIQSIETSSG